MRNNWSSTGNTAMTTSAQGFTAESQVRQVLEAGAAAVRAKDIGAAVASYAPDVLLFDLIEPLQTRGIDALRARLEQWFASFEGPLDFELRELEITAGDDVAFCHSLNHVKATKVEGGLLEMQWRATLCLQRIEGKWLVVHSHTSVPFNMETGQASME
jgi:uncharacterized protein (TIGR02246 family)